MRPVFCQHTDCPTVIVTEDGVKAKLSVALTVAAAPLLAHRLVDEALVELLQATAVRAQKAKSARLVRIGKNLRVWTSGDNLATAEATGTKSNGVLSYRCGGRLTARV